MVTVMCMSSNGLYIDVANCERPFSRKKVVSSIVMMYKEIALTCVHPSCRPIQIV